MPAITYQLPMKRARSTCATGLIGAISAARAAVVSIAKPRATSSDFVDCIANSSRASPRRRSGLDTSGTYEAVVRHQPLPAIGIAEQLRAGHPEHAPALKPQRRGLAAVGPDQRGHHRIPVCILIGQPVIGRALVMSTIDMPALLDVEVALKPEQGIGGRHQAAGEEMPAHPIILAAGFERVH